MKRPSVITGEYQLRQDCPALWVALRFQRNHKGDPLTLDGHRYMAGIYMDRAPYQILMKSTQAGATEYLIAKAIVKAMIQGRQVFYVLPSWGLQTRFVKNRWDKTVFNTPIYRTSIHEINSGMSNQRESMSLKQMGRGVVAFVSSQSSSGFTEFPADDIIIDELDECDQETVPMAEERLSHSKDPRQIKVGNPTFPNFGISYEYSLTDKKKWFVKCPKCGKWINPSFFDHVVREVAPGVYALRDEEWEPGCGRDIQMIHDCGEVIDRFAGGTWVAEHPSLTGIRSGFQFNKLFSSLATVESLVERFNKGLVNDTVMQRFYNADLGLDYVAKGAKIDQTLLDDCIGDYIMPPRCADPCVAGVDVGSVLHVRINRILDDGRDQAVFIGSVKEEEDLLELCTRYNIVCGVIDSMPEIRLSRRMVQRRGWFKCSFHGDARDHKDNLNPETRDVSCGRTEILDAVKEKIMCKNLILPKNVASLPEYYDHVQSSVRVFDDKRQTYTWVEGSAADHLLFAEAYAHLARRIIAAAR